MFVLRATIEGPFTIFAPTNYSFLALDKEIKDNITDLNYLRRLLQYHVVPGRNLSYDFKPAVCLPTLIDNTSLAINYAWNNYRLRVNHAPIIVVDIEAKNGVIHVIEDVLIPPDKPGCPYKEERRRPPIQPSYNGYGGAYGDDVRYYGPRQDTPVQYYPWL